MYQKKKKKHIKKGKKLVGFDLLFFCAIPATDWVSLQNMSRLIFYSMAAIFI